MVGKWYRSTTSILELECSTSWQVRDVAALSETDSLNCVGGTFVWARRVLTWNDGAADDLARQHGCRAASVARCVGGRTEDPSAPTQDRLTH